MYSWDQKSLRISLNQKVSDKSPSETRRLLNPCLFLTWTTTCNVLDLRIYTAGDDKKFRSESEFQELVLSDIKNLS